MKKLLQLIALCCLIVIGSCSPKIRTSLQKALPPLEYDQEVFVIGLNQQIPDKSEIFGQVKIGDTGFSTNCSYEVVIDQAKLEARKAGGNAIQIVEHKPPTAMGSTCHRIKANILKIDGIENLPVPNHGETLLDIDHAILHVYRYGGTGSLVGYDLFLGDSMICRVSNKFKTTLEIHKDGLNTLWAKTESKVEVPVNIKFGKEYYLRCGINLGVLVGRPKLELVDNKIGKLEFESLKNKNQ